jgi:hypothetical protein
MRNTHSFLLRLLIAPDCPHILRGTLHVVATSHDYTFADEQALLDLLHRLSTCSVAKVCAPAEDGGTVEDENC